MSLRFRLAVLPLVLAAATAQGDDPNPGGRTLTGKDALGDWTTDAPGVRRKITVDDLATPYDTPSANNLPRVVKRPEGAWPKAPEGFEVTEFATGLTEPRVIVRAPNGDLFVAESRANRIRVLRDADGDGKPEVNEVFATGLNRPFGIAFYPLGAEPEVRLRRQHRLGRPLPLQERRHEGLGRGRDDRQGHPQRQRERRRRRALDAGPGVLARRQDPVRLGRLALERRRRRERKPPGRHPGVRPRRQERARLRLRHPQPGRPGDASEDRPALDLGERARRAGRQPGARLHHARRGGRLLRLALVLPRPEPGPAARGKAPRAEGQGDRPRRAPAVAHGLARPDVLRRRRSSRRSTTTTPSPPSTARGTGPAASATRSSACR